MKELKPMLAVIAAGVLWGIISFFVRSLASAGLEPLQISLIRMVMATLIVFPVLGIRNPALLRIRIKDVWVFIGTGIVSIVFFNTLYFYATIYSQASVAVVLLYTSPVFVLLFSAVLFRERITRRRVFCLGMTILGCVLVGGLLGGDYRLSGRVLAAGLGSGFFYALYTIFARYALRRYDSMTVTAYSFLFGMLGSLPLGDPAGTMRILTAEPILILSCIGIGLISTAFPYILYTWGLQRMDSGRAAILVAVEPLVGAVVGMVFCRESHSLTKLTGILLILCAVLLLNLPERPKGRQRTDE